MLLKEYYTARKYADPGNKKIKIIFTYVLPEHKRDLKEFSLISVVKFILTEGEKFIIFAFSDFVSITVITF